MKTIKSKNCAYKDRERFHLGLYLKIYKKLQTVFWGYAIVAFQS